MVKGVNKTVIEINDTGSNLFERVVLFVSPDYGNISTVRLKNEAENIIRRLDSESYSRKSIRKHYKLKKRIKYFSVAILAVLITVGCFLIFK